MAGGRRYCPRCDTQASTVRHASVHGARQSIAHAPGTQLGEHSAHEHSHGHDHDHDHTIMAPEDIPIGIVTSLVGGAFFIRLLHRHA